jgi:hypothetical protein
VAEFLINSRQGGFKVVGVLLAQRVEMKPGYAR